MTFGNGLIVIFRKMMKPGRQRSGYYRFALWSIKRLCCDAHIIYYPAGGEIPPHHDPSPVRDKTHYRMNIILKKPNGGGQFTTHDPDAKLFFNRVVVFCPEYIHWLTRCRGTGRLVLSFGWLSK